jgi:hypothetical protein
MTVRIHNLNDRTTYLATCAADCHGVDRHAYEMATMLGDVITMGKIIADPNPENAAAHGFRHIAAAS